MLQLYLATEEEKKALISEKDVGEMVSMLDHAMKEQRSGRYEYPVTDVMKVG